MFNEFWQQTTFRKQIIIGGMVTATLLGFWLFVGLSHSGKTKVGITVVPSNSQVTVDGKEVSSGTVYLKPGDYTFKASANGYKDDVQDVLVENESIKLGLVPVPDSEAARQWLADNPQIQRQRESIGGQNADRNGERVRKATPLISKLPRTELNGPYEIGYGPSLDRKDGIFIEINYSSPNGRKKALKWIRDQGTDPTDLEIRYVDFSNPLTSAEEAE